MYGTERSLWGVCVRGWRGMAPPRNLRGPHQKMKEIFLDKRLAYPSILNLYSNQLFRMNCSTFLLSSLFLNFFAKDPPGGVSRKNNDDVLTQYFYFAKALAFLRFSYSVKISREVANANKHKLHLKVSYQFCHKT